MSARVPPQRAPRPWRWPLLLWLLIVVFVLAVGVFALGFAPRLPGPDVGQVTLNGVPGTVIESFGRTTGVINDFIPPGSYAQTRRDVLRFGYAGSPTWVTVIVNDASGRSRSTGGPPGQFTIPAGTWDWVTAKVYWAENINVTVGWRLSDRAPADLLAPG